MEGEICREGTFQLPAAMLGTFLCDLFRKSPYAQHLGVGGWWREDGAWEKLVPGPFIHADSGRTNSVTLDPDSELGEPFWLHLEDLAPVVGMGP